jgi:hypothetical protein
MIERVRITDLRLRGTTPIKGYVTRSYKYKLSFTRQTRE